MKFDNSGQYFKVCTNVEGEGTWDNISLNNLAKDCYYDASTNLDVKTKIDQIYSELRNAINVHKSSGDHDKRYYLKSEIDKFLKAKQDTSTAINIYNIGDQSVANADTVDGLHASSFQKKSSTLDDVIANWSTFKNKVDGAASSGDIQGKVNRSGDTMTGALSMGGHNLTGVYGLYGKDRLYLKASNNSNSVVIGGEALNVVHNSGSDPEPWADVLCDHVHYHGGLVNDSYSKVKKNIKKINDKEAKKILEVPIYTFDYINGYGNNAKNQIGTLYDDIKDIIPNATYVPDGWDEETFDIETANPMEDYVPGVSYIDLIPYLIAMIQIQQKEIDELKEKVSALESK